MSIWAILIVCFTIVFLALVYLALKGDISANSDITRQIIREHEEEIKRLRQKRYE